MPRIVVLLQLLPVIVFFTATVGVGLIGAFGESLWISGPAARALGNGPAVREDAVAATGDRRTPEGSGPAVGAAYRALLNTPGIGASVVYSLLIAGVSAFFAVAIGAVGAYVLWRSPAYIKTVGTVYKVPIVMPHIVVAFVTVLLWSPHGFVAAVLARLGVDVAHFPHLVYSANGAGIVLAYVYKGFPFVMLLCHGVLQRTPSRLVDTARMLGAGHVRTFFRVILPILSPTVHQIAIILFLYALGGFDIPWLIGASRPQMIPVTVYSLFFQGDLSDRPTAMAALSLLAAGAALFAIIYTRIVRRVSPAERVV